MVTRTDATSPVHGVEADTSPLGVCVTQGDVTT